MANAAAKKAAKAGAGASKQYLPLLILANLCYLLIRLGWKYNTSRGFHIFLLVVHIAVSVIGYFGLVQSAQNNIHSEYYFDLYVVACVSAVVSSLTDWGALLLLTIPGYAGYLLLQHFLTKNTAVPEHQEQKQEETTNKKEKKQKTKFRKIH